LIDMRPSLSLLMGSAQPRAGVFMDAIDSDVHLIRPGIHFNTRMEAPNVWEVDIDSAIVDEAVAVFELDKPFGSVTHDGEPYESVQTSVGPFFVQRINWHSDACWASVDDRASYDTFCSLFERLGLPKRLASLYPLSEGLRLYSAFYVVRSWCSARNFHVDYKPEVGMDAMTLLTPLYDYAETDTFQLSYLAHRGGLDPEAQLTESDPRAHLRRYVYRKGKAILFGSRFMHSTEPGAGLDGQPHAYLSLTFGTTRQAAWPQIARTLDTQSRLIATPDGCFGLSRLGSRIEEMVVQHAAQDGVPLSG